MFIERSKTKALDRPVTKLHRNPIDIVSSEYRPAETASNFICPTEREDMS